MTRLAVVLCLLLAAPLAVSAAPFQRQLASDHFRITYTSGVGPDAVSATYARLVRDSLESAYEFLVSEHGFEIFPGRIDIQIISLECGAMGTEYLDESTGTPRPVIEIATEMVMEEAVYSLWTDITLEDLVRSTAAHELFHVIQDFATLQGENDISEGIFVEAHATAIQEIVVPAANDYLDPALDFFLAPDSMAFFQRSYEAGVFWFFAFERFGWAKFVRDLMTASAAYEGLYALKRVLTGYGTTLTGLWGEFALALATGKLPDQHALQDLRTVLEDTIEWETGQPIDGPIDLPTPVHVTQWRGAPLVIDQVNAEGWGSWYGTYPEDEAGSPLRVAHAYGIDVIDIVPASSAPAAIRIHGDEETAFQVFAAFEQSGAWTTKPLAMDTPWTLSSPESFDRIRLIITRSEAGTGTYSITVSPETP